LNALKKIIRASLEIISKEGFPSYLSHVKTKIKRREMRVLTPIVFTKNEEQDLINAIKMNEKTRLQIKQVDDEKLKEDRISFSFEDIDFDDNVPISVSETPVCTIISKNYLAHARVFTDSFLKHNPHGRVYVLLVDENKNDFDFSREKFSLINLKDIDLPETPSFLFRYNILEQNTNVKAHFMKYLFEKFKIKKLAYFDPDILFTAPLDNMWKLLDKKSIILTPHITSRIKDNRKPSELDILRSGSYNLGFLALANNENTKEFLNWWMQHLLQQAYEDVEKGFFVDQKWIDLVPSIFHGVYVLKHPGFNAAYWNFSEREFKIVDEKIYVNEKPLYFFHFSGFVPEDIDIVSKHQNRYSLKDLEKINPLFRLYRDLLIENGYFDAKKKKFAHDYFDNGMKIPLIARRIYSKATDRGLDFGNPFLATGKNSFLEYLNQNIDGREPTITRLWYQIYYERDDLQLKYPDLLIFDRVKFVKKMQESLPIEYDLDEFFLPKHVIKNFDTLDDSSVRLSKSSMGTIKGKKQISTKVTEKDFGINVAGYFKGEFGVAESARSYIKALNAANIPYTLNNIESSFHKNEDSTLDDFDKNNPYPVNLVVINADQTETFAEIMTNDYFKNKYNIAIWAWELSKFPKKWMSNLKYYDEIWTLSHFVSDSMAKHFPIPVIKITCPTEIDETKLKKNRIRFGLKETDYVFLFIFDFASVFERKNPMGVIEAFKNAFTVENNDVKLVLKSINGSKFPDQLKKLKNSIVNHKNIIHLEEHFDRDAVFSLIASSDCYVSLHRSEGFGLTITESMFAGKPVIATDYGGNTDFMNISNSFPVKYELVELKEDYGPYTKGNVWAEPNIEHASQLMKSVYENKKFAIEIGEKGSNYIKKYMNAKVSGQDIFDRITNIKNV